jgi:integrase
VRTPSGSVRQLPDKRWLARIRWTDRATGQRTEKSEIVSSKNVGNDRLAKWRGELAEHGAVPDRRRDATAAETVTTIAQLAEFYRERYAVPAVYAGDKKISGMRAWTTVRGHVAWIEELLGGRPLKAITYGELHDLRDDMLKRETFRGTLCSIAYANRVLSTLRRMLHVARQRRWMQHNPFDEGDPLVVPSLEAERDRIATPQEEAALIANCDPEKKRAHLRTIIVVAIETGMRQGEILGLKKGDVDFEQRVIRVAALNSKALQWRYVPMTKRCAVELRRYMRAVPDAWETLFNVGSVDTAFRGARRDAKIDDLTFHDLRHTFITRALARGLPEPLVQKVVGHRPGTKTTRRYTNIDVQLAQSLADQLDGVRKSVAAASQTSGARPKARQSSSRRRESKRTAGARHRSSRRAR